MTDERRLTEHEFHRSFAARLFNEVWELLEKPARTRDEDDRMIHAAHASRYHWQFAGNAKNLAVGEWQIARVYSTLGRAEPALYHATRCVEIAEENGFSGFYLASAYEGMARALAVNGSPASRDFIARAQKISAEIVDPEEKAILAGDLASIKTSE